MESSRTIAFDPGRISAPSIEVVCSMLSTRHRARIRPEDFPRSPTNSAIAGLPVDNSTNGSDLSLNVEMSSNVSYVNRLQNRRKELKSTDLPSWQCSHCFVSTNSPIARASFDVLAQSRSLPPGSAPRRVVPAHPFACSKCCLARRPEVPLGSRQTCGQLRCQLSTES